MHCKIIDRYFNAFFVEIQLKKENLITVFLAPEFGRPSGYTGLQNDLNTSLPFSPPSNSENVTLTPPPLTKVGFMIF